VFDEKQIKAYHNIKAPDRIYKRLNRKGYSLGVLAACLVCAVMLTIFLRPNETKIMAGGQTLENSVVVEETLMRSAEITVPFKIENGETTEITVSEGALLFSGSESKTLTVDGDGTFSWQIEKKDLPAEISISDENGVKSFTLIYENSKYILRRKEK